jgi:hypothetical protein
MQANSYPSVFRSWLRLWNHFGFEGSLSGPQSPDFLGIGCQIKIDNKAKSMIT